MKYLGKLLLDLLILVVGGGVILFLVILLLGDKIEGILRGILGG